jgi:hypothetical protein
MTFEDFRKHLIEAANNGTLMTPKHDPNNLGTTVFSSYRTVLSHDLAANLLSFINSGNYTVIEFENKKLPNSPLYFEITPNQDSGFAIPASGVTANSTFASTVVDKIIAVSGNTYGWHLFGEDGFIVQHKLNNGDLLRKNNLI